MKRTAFFFFAIISFCLCFAINPFNQETRAQSGQSLDDRLKSIMSRPEFKHAMFGIEFYSLDQQKPIYRYNAEKFFVPGSTTKLVTMGSALEMLGSDYRFHTRVYRTGPISSDGTLDGDLVLVASGDPNLSGRIQSDGTLAFEDEDHSYAGGNSAKVVPGDPLMVIKELASQVAEKNIKSIRGRVIIDSSLFPEGDRELGTGVVISPIVVNDNLVDVTVSPGAEGQPARLEIAPETSYLKIINQITTGKAGSKLNLDIASDAQEEDGSHTVTVTGSIPSGSEPSLTVYPVPSPTRFAEVTLVQALREKGITVELSSFGRKADLKAASASYTTENVVAEHVSPPYKEEVKVTLKVSQNLHASMTPFITASIMAKGEKKNGFDLERDLFTRAGLDLSGASQADGAGGDAHFSPDFMVAYLTYMSKQKNFDDFHHALPILGRDGTLVDIQKDSPAAGHVHAKTGTYGGRDLLNKAMFLSGKGLAGYMTTASGKKVAFALYLNNMILTDPNQVTTIAGQVLGEIAAAGYELIK